MKHSILVLILLASATLTACSSTNKKLTEEAKKEPVTNTQAEIQTRLNELVTSDTKLSGEKKSAILQILDRVAKENHEIQILINQKKSLVLKELLSPTYNRKRANTILTSIAKLNSQQLSNSLKGWEEAVDVLEKRDSTELFMERLMDTGGRW